MAESMKLSLLEKNEIRLDAKDIKRREIFRIARVSSQSGSLDDYIDFLSENMPLFQFTPSVRITSNYKL